MDIIKLAQEKKEEEKQKIKQAYDRIPDKYHCFIIMIEQSKKLVNFEISDIPEKGEELGVYSYKGATYIKIKNPYMKVDGRIAMFSDKHAELSKEDNRFTFKVESNLVDIAKILAEQGELPHYYPLIVEIESDLYGHLEGESKIFWNDSNPLENAKTSALGRAIAQTGIGLIGTGVASYEEVIKALENGNQKKKSKLTKKEEEIKGLIGDNKSLKNELYSYLGFLDKKNINDLTDKEFFKLKKSLIKSKQKPIKQAN